ncbi:MAG TPA: hypothetical protein PKA10_18335 [Selenomonadales bacterium]|nr:hypothetical protein [Selenomonadales bacterium]
MIWWPIIENLVVYFRSLPEFAEINVHPGTEDPINYYPCMEVVWDHESNMNPYKPTKGSLTLWIDEYVVCENSTEAYKMLYDVQQQSFAALRGWPAYAIDTIGVALNVKVLSVASSDGALRPVTGGRIILEIEWRKKGYENG